VKIYRRSGKNWQVILLQRRNAATDAIGICFASILHYLNAKNQPEDAVNSPAENLQSMLCIQPIRPPSAIGNIENDAIQALAASSSDTFPPELATFLQYVEEHGHRVSQDLAAGIDHLQELFLGALYQNLQLAGLTVGSRMIISLNRQGKLHIETASAEQAQIEELLSSSMALPALLKLLSAHSAILDGIRNLRLVAGSQGRGDCEKFSQAQQTYRVCLKGQLSHFYSV